MADSKTIKGGLNLAKRLMMSDAELAAQRAQALGHSGDNVLPLRLPRANLSDEYINANAERVARQMMGEHVMSGKPKDTRNLAGRSMKESQRLKGLDYELKPTGNVAPESVHEPRKGDVMVAFPGDQTVSDSILHRVGDIEGIDSHQQGGARYGLGQKHLEDPEFWKSTVGPAKMVQGKVDRIAQYYEPERVIGSHLAMGSTANNFAMHFADANLKAIDWSKAQPKNISVFDNIVAGGYKDPKSGELVSFPNWPGLANPEAALQAMKEDSNLRKWFNDRMKTPSLTQPLGLPNGLDIQYAITEPRIRDMEINMTGLMNGELRPNAPVEDAGAVHNTYSHRILGEAHGAQDVLTPFTISFPDAAQHIASTKRPSDFTGTIQKVFPHQIVDDQYINQYNQYRDRIKQLTGQKKGGAISEEELDRRLADGIAKRMAGGGAAFKKLDFTEDDNPLQVGLHASKMGDNEMTGVSANLDMKGAGRLGVGSNLAGRNGEMHSSAMMNYGNNIGDLGVNANVMKPTDAPNDMLMTNVMASYPIGQGRVTAGMHGNRMDGTHRVTGHSLGYNAPLAGGNLNVNVMKPKDGKPMVGAQYVHSFDKGGRAGAIKGGAKAFKRLFADPAESSMMASGTRKFGDEMGGNNIVKDVGGNWLSGSVERSVAPLRQTLTTPHTLASTSSYDPAANLAKIEQRWTPEIIDRQEKIYPRIRTAVAEAKEQLKPQAELNNWIDRNLTNYIKKQMATPNDPIRKLAEEGVTHLPSDTRMPPNMSSVNATRAEAGFPEPMGKSELAQKWEAWADKPVGFGTAGEMISTGKGEPWMDKVDPFTRVHGIAPNYQNHMFTDLGFDHVVDVLKADLAAGRIRPEQLNKVSIEDAVRRTHQYNEELAKKMQEARMAEIPAAKVHKEYPEGYKWVQLDQPGQFAHESDVMGHSVRGYEPAQDHPEWTVHSGEEGWGGYGHGGWEGIKSGNAKIYSLRDPKGQAHATIEVKAPKTYTEDDVMAQFPSGVLDAIKAKGQAGVDEYVASKLQELNSGSPVITQVKGKQNKAPNEEYLPYIQDFVKSGKWDDVRDFSNTGLIKEADQYMTPAEHGDWLLRQLEKKHGGIIREPKHFDGGGIAAADDSKYERVPFTDTKKWRDIKRNAADIYDEGKNQLEKEFQQLKTKGGKKDFAIRVGSQVLGGAPDLVNLGLEGLDVIQSYIPALSKPESVLDTAGTGERVPKLKLASDKPFMGSQHFMDKFKEAELLGKNEFPLIETATGFLSPAAEAALIKGGSKIYRGAKALSDTK